MNIAISNLASSVTAHDLRQLFKPYGSVGMITSRSTVILAASGLWLRGHD
jgi:hypothetical protein